jgi:RNA recognition motif-containing protein
MNIYITNLSVHVMDRDLDRLFSAYGTVGFAVIVRDRTNGRSRGIAFVDMPVRAQGEQAIRALHRMEIDGQEISVRELQYRQGEFKN